MRAASLLVLVSMRLFAAPETVLTADRVADLLILNQVFLNSQGPFRMMVDTGNNSSAVRREVANRLRLRPAYTVWAATAVGVKPVAAVLLDEVRIGPMRDNAVEVMIMDLEVAGVDGVLGESWLIRHDYVLDYRGRRLVVDAAEPPGGIRTPLRCADGRPQVSAVVNGHPQDLVVGSGTSVLILFGRKSAIRPAFLVTNIGSVEAANGSARVALGPGYSRRLPTAQIDASPQPGLLPASAFKSIYVSNRDGVVVFVP